MSKLFMKGNVSISIATLISIGSALVIGTANYFIQQNALASTTATVNNRVTVICNHDADALSRIDQNTQNIAKAFNVPYVTGTYNPDLCN